MLDMRAPERKWYGALPLFDPAEGETVVPPPAPGRGHWAGAPSVLYAADRSRFYLSYRLRYPRPVRGGETYIAESADGVSFQPIWRASKDDLGSASVERFGLARARDGGWLLYPSYVDPADNRWRIDVVAAEAPDAFDLSRRLEVLTATGIGAEGVKDPWVMVVDGLYYMLVSYAVRLQATDAAEEARRHATGDIYNTGLTLSSTGLAVGGDGLEYEWQGELFAPRPGRWDGYAARLGCLLPTPAGWVGFYDGSATVDENYEERTGLVHSPNLARFYRLSQKGPLLTAPHGSGSLRYIDAVVVDGTLYIYYEYARADGSHELRLNRLAGWPAA